MGMTRKQISLWGPRENPAKRFSWGEEEGTEQSEISSNEGLLRSDVLPAELLPPVSKAPHKKRKTPER